MKRFTNANLGLGATLDERLYLDELMDVTKAGQLIGVTPRTLQTWRLDKAGPLYVRVGHHIRYRRGDILDWLKSRTFTDRAAEQAQE